MTRQVAAVPSGHTTANVMVEALNADATYLHDHDHLHYALTQLAIAKWTVQDVRDLVTACGSLPGQGTHPVQPASRIAADHISPRHTSDWVQHIILSRNPLGHLQASPLWQRLNKDTSFRPRSTAYAWHAVTTDTTLVKACLTHQVSPTQAAVALQNPAFDRDLYIAGLQTLTALRTTP